MGCGIIIVLFRQKIIISCQEYHGHYQCEWRSKNSTYQFFLTGEFYTNIANSARLPPPKPTFPGYDKEKAPSILAESTQTEKSLLELHTC